MAEQLLENLLLAILLERLEFDTATRALNDSREIADSRNGGRLTVPDRAAHGRRHHRLEVGNGEAYGNPGSLIHVRRTP